MLKHIIIPAALVLTLAACNDQKKAEAPKENTVVATAPPSSTAPSTASSGASSQAGRSAAAGASSTAASETTGGVGTPGSASVLQKYQGKSYTAGPVSLRLNQDGTFEMTETDGNKQVQGRYAFENGIVTFSQPTGDVGSATFPMRCRLQEAGDSFSFAPVENSCERLRDLTFKTQA